MYLLRVSVSTTRLLNPSCIVHRHWVQKRVRAKRLEAKGFDPAKPDASREMQMEASRYLAELVDATNPEKKAEELAEKLDESFFIVASTYLEMAKKEKQNEVVSKLESVLKIAMKAKNKTLRPEIQVDSFTSKLNSVLFLAVKCTDCRAVE